MTVGELIVFPDVEDLIRLYLEAELPAMSYDYEDVGCFAAALPAVLPALSVLVRRTGGIAGLVVDQAQITLEVRAPLSKSAHDLLQMCRALINLAARAGMMFGTTVYEVQELSGPYRDPDPANPKHERYTNTFLIAVRGTTARAA